MKNQQKAQDSPEAVTNNNRKKLSTLSPLCRAPGVGAWRSRSERWKATETQQKTTEQQKKRSKTAQKTAEKAANNMKNQQKAQDSPEAGTKNNRKHNILDALSSLSGPRCGCVALAKRALKSHGNATQTQQFCCMDDTLAAEDPKQQVKRD